MQSLTGEVTRDALASGSKSERDAVLLKTDRGTFVLRRAGGNAFRDPELDELVGKRITATGEVHGYTFLMASWSEA